VHLDAAREQEVVVVRLRAILDAADEDARSTQAVPAVHRSLRFAVSPGDQVVPFERLIADDNALGMQLAAPRVGSSLGLKGRGRVHQTSPLVVG